jgi:intracellular multiplication protein IcmB
MGVLETFKGALGMMTKKPLSSFNFLETCDGENIMVGKDGSLMSLIRLNGSRVMMGRQELNELVEKASIKFSPYFGHSGHAIQFWFLRDPTRSKEVVENQIKPAKHVAKELQLEIDDLFHERVQHLSKFVVHEDIYMAVWTRVSILSSQEIKKLKLEQKAPDLWPSLPDTQNIFTSSKIMSYRHQGFAKSVIQDLKDFGMKSEILDCHDALRIIKESLYPDLGHTQWKPYIPGDRIKRKRKEPINRKAGESNRPYPRGEPQSDTDISPLLWPTLDDQLFDKSALAINNQIVKMGRYYYCGIDMIMGPQDTQSFAELLSRLKEEKYPWRVSFLLEGDNFTKFNFMAQIASVTAFTNSDNRNIKYAMDAIRDYKSAGGVSCKYRVSFATWAPEPGLDLIEEQAARLQKNIEAWGYCQASPAAGDPLAGTLSSSLGISVSSTAPAGIPPLPEAIRMLPWQRDAAPFDNGAILFRTEDGRPWAWQPGSSQQDTFIDIIFAPPGKGKSVLMNTTNLAFCLSPKATLASGGVMLPRIAIIDIGFSSSGLISLIKEALPASRRHEAMAYRLKMTREHSINPFDTQLGCRFPLSQEKSFLINFITLLATDPADKTAPRGMSDLVARAVDELYAKYDDRGKGANVPKPYVEGEDKVVDEAIKHHGIILPEETTWWYVVDELFEHGDIRHAILAQRYAVPLIHELSGIVNIPQITDIYGEQRIDGNEKLITAFQRTISSSLRSYSILSQPTKFDIGDSRIVSMNLEEVAPKGEGPARKQTSMVYMLARYVLARDFYLNEDNVKEIPKDYRIHHEARIKRNKETPKRIVYDEFHRTEGSQPVREQVVIDMREGRKWGVEISIASQLLTDFNETMLGMATGFWILGANNANEEASIARMFGLSATARYALKNYLNGPTSKGAPFITVLNMKDGRHEHLLYNTLGPMEMWAFNTTSEDVAIRSNLYTRLGPEEARKRLAKRFPGGGAKKEVERRIAEQMEHDEYDNERGKGSIIEQIIEEIVRDD